MRASADSAAIASPAYSTAYPRAPCAPMTGNDVQHDILRRRSRLQRAVHDDAHVLRDAVDERLRGQHVLDLRGADAEP
jgi:hypothetical protein